MVPLAALFALHFEIALRTEPVWHEPTVKRHRTAYSHTHACPSQQPCLLSFKTSLRGWDDVCRILAQPSKVLAVSLPRPMGIVLEEDTQRGRVVVSELAEGSEAAKRAKVGIQLLKVL